MKLDVRVYRSGKTSNMYLYVDAIKDLEPVPEALLARFGKAVQVMELALTPQRTLARADVRDVIAKVQETGFYLQMPPIIATGSYAPLDSE